MDYACAIKAGIQNVAGECCTKSFCTSPAASIMKRTFTVFDKLKSLPASAVIVDASGKIVTVNNTWKEFGRQNGLRIPHSAVGENYLQYCHSDDPASRGFVKQLKSLLAGQLDFLTYIYPCHSPLQKRWFALIGFPLSLDQPSGVALLHVNLTDMLPTSTGQMLEKKQRRGRSIINLNAISDAVEHSVSETLSAQLSAIFIDPRRRIASEKTAKLRDDSDEMNFVHARLSKRQLQVLRLLGEGKTNKEMAKALFLSPNTIKLHVSAILQRLNLKSRTHAALLSSSINKSY